MAVFLEKLMRKEPIMIHGDGTQSRDFIFVEDIVSANIAAMQQKESGMYHASTGMSHSILDLVECFRRIDPSLVHEFTRSRNGDITHSCLCNDKAISHLKWKPIIDLASGIHETWYRS